ncbi:MAG: hypothetical protein DPW09_27455 [Anaerolineae bacterium]|nr:tetratricopeptide repeat protein [Anaerolineales bacterium]MCQ3977182.1 hypothetical protein [Anaerolineae bacterium]
MNQKLIIRLLGHVAIEVDGRPLSRLPSRAAEALLIYLVCHHQPIPRETLPDLLWGERTQKQGLTNLRTILTSLRRELDEYLVITRETLAFNHAADYWLDVAEFENEQRQLQPQLSTSMPLSPETAPRLQSNLDLYQGDFLAGFSLREGREFEAWALFRREQLKRQASLGLHCLAAHHRAAGDYQQGLRQAEKLLHLDPYDEAAQRQVMGLLVRCGQPNEALRRYQQFRRLLAEELGLEPTPETNQLYQRIKAARAFSSNNLPDQVTPFVGRKIELQQLNAYLANPHCRLVTLVGPGGIGKTRLALEVARQQQPVLLHGVCFVPLTDLPSADFLVWAIAEAVHLSLHGVNDPQAQLLNALREREILLLLDNFEHLLAAQPSSPELGTQMLPRNTSENHSAAGLALLSHILETAPEVKIMVTSRERLNLEEEWLFQVKGLLVPEATQAAEVVAGSSAVQLFRQNASRVQSGFTPTEAELAEIGRICRLVEGLPLAIQLASAWIRVMSCRQIAAEIEDNLAFLQSSAHNALPRQRSIEAVFDHSWQLLTPEEQQILGQLSVFKGGFKAAAAEQVAGAALSTLVRLVDKSWLSGNAQGRYEWHDLLRRYTAEKSGQDSASQTAAARHAEFYAAFLKDQQSPLEGKKQVEALAEVTAELENVRAAWHWAVVQNRFDLIGQSLESAWIFYEIKGWFYEGEEIFRQAVDALAHCQAARPSQHPDAGQRQLLAQLLIRQGWFCMRLARLDQAQQHLEQGLSLARQFQDYLETGRGLHHLGIVLMLLGQYAAARQLLEESLAVYQQNGGNHFELGSALGTLGIILTRMGRFDEAKPVIDRGISHYWQAGNPRAIALNYSFLGGFSIQTGNYSQAIPLLREGLTFQRMIDDRVMIRMSLAWLGEIHEMLGEYDEANRQYEESLLIAQGNGDLAGTATAWLNLGRLNVSLGKVYQAKRYLRAGLKLAREFHYQPLIVDGLISMALLLVQQGHKQRALEVLIPALNHPAGEPQMRARAEQILARLTDTPLTEILSQIEATNPLETVVAELLTFNLPAS